MVMPEKVVFKRRGKQLKRLTWVGQYDLLLNFHLQSFIYKVRYPKDNLEKNVNTEQIIVITEGDKPFSKNEL